MRTSRYGRRKSTIARHPIYGYIPRTIPEQFDVFEVSETAWARHDWPAVLIPVGDFAAVNELAACIYDETDFPITADALRRALLAACLREADRKVA